MREEERMVKDQLMELDYKLLILGKAEAIPLEMWELWSNAYKIFVGETNG